METFTELIEGAQGVSQDHSPSTEILFKKWINEGKRKFDDLLSREYRDQEKFFSTVADQRYYQLPEDAIRPSEIVITVGDIDYPLEEVADRKQWLYLTSRPQSSDIPEYYFVKGSDQFGIYPTPSTSLASAGLLIYEPKSRDMQAADYTEGTVTVTNGSAVITGAGTSFTAQMVGRYLKLDDPAGDGMGYRVAAFTDATTITLENVYAGSTASGQSYRIGEAPSIPEAYHDSLTDYALYRWYQRRKDRGNAADHKSIFAEALGACQATYASKSSSQYFRPVKNEDMLRLNRRRYSVSNG